MYNIESGKVLKAKHKLSGKVIEFVKVGDKFSRVYSEFLGAFYMGEKISENKLLIYYLNPHSNECVANSGCFVVVTDIGAASYGIVNFETSFDIVY